VDELLEIEDLQVEFTAKKKRFAAVSGVSLKLGRGRTLGLVGESGSGKTVTSLAVMRLIPAPPGRITGGQIRFQGRDLVALTDEEMRSVRGKEISMVFQEPMTALNPVFTAGDQVAEVYRIHLRLGRKEALDRAIEMLAKVGIADPSRRAREYPHQMSGGMRQRVLIAIALACRPALLIADEPTTALDVTVQAQILNLMEELRDEMGTALLLITHDLGVVAESADDVAVMYGGRIVEQAACRSLFETPRHPYTAGLLHSRPVLGRRGAGRHLDAIPGAVPDPRQPRPGCAFEPRCPRRAPICAERMPPIEELAPGHLARCWVPLS
jgi:oligopeptide/dipeptide ABC transporter ATP-binding protein